MYCFYAVIKRWLSFFFLLFLISNCFSQQISTADSIMVQKFYALNKQPLFWLSSDKGTLRAKEWLKEIYSFEKSGIISDKLLIDHLQIALFNKKMNPDVKVKTDILITGLVLNFIKKLQQGNVNLSYDEISVSRDSVYINQLLNLKPAESAPAIISQLDCKDPQYVILKNYLKDSITVKDTLKYKSVLLSLNFRRYLSANHQSEYIIVNIPAADLQYFRNDSLILKMKTVMGKKRTPTPVFASYISYIETFPSWNVPHSIAVKEILPNVQKNVDYLEKNNFEVIDAQGNLLEDSELNWSDYNATNFPFYFRQSTGANNALGVLKFVLQNPFSIFLHATSWQGVFTKEIRFLSHGCIRLEKPFDLAGALLRGKINIEELKIGKSNTKSFNLNLPHKVPCFIIYMPATVVDNKLTFFSDVYGLIQK